MRRLGHGETAVTPGILADTGLAQAGSSFGRMFPGLADDPNNLLPEGPGTLAALSLLGKAMGNEAEDQPEAGRAGPGDGVIPAGYTYLGQFIDHDITFDAGGDKIEVLADPEMRPRPDLNGLRNHRTVQLDLDSVYGSEAPRDGDRLVVGQVTDLNNPNPPTRRPPGKGDRNDLPRQGRSSSPDLDRAALIGDPRNDENLIISQLHVAFLKAHNALVREGRSFAQARTALRQRYQRMILHDFLARVCDKAVLDDVLANGPRWGGGADASAPVMPVEFAVAAYRFGHSMIRTFYDFNVNFGPAGVRTGLDLLFTFTALSGQLGIDDGFDTLPENWIIQWERFIEIDGSRPQVARQINTQLTRFTFELRNVLGKPEGTGSTDQGVIDIAPKLAVRNLLRGYRLKVPTGQAVARALGVVPLAGASLLGALPNDALRRAAEPFADRTPLWFYVLAEAGDPRSNAGRHLGTVGSRIVCDAFWTFIRASEDSILAPGPHPDLPANFTLADLIALAATEEKA